MTPFNAFHHALAGILICGLGLSLSYAPRISILAGLYTAWIPWAFPASIMWRDSVGLGWVAVALSLLLASRRFGIWGVLVTSIPAGFLLHSDRIAYVFLPLVFLIIYILDKKKLRIQFDNINVNKQIFIFSYTIIIFILFISTIGIFFNEYIDYFNNLPSRLINIPFLIIRAISGPFPWFSNDGKYYYVIFDYLFHVFQLALIMSVGKNNKYYIKEIDAMFLFGLAIWFMAVVATGVHTAYLAIGIPFMLPKILSIKSNITIELISSFCIFVALNCLYLLSGLHGSGSVMNVTGY